MTKRAAGLRGVVLLCLLLLAASQEDGVVMMPVMVPHTKAKGFNDLIADVHKDSTLTLSLVCGADAKKNCGSPNVYEMHIVDCLTRKWENISTTCQEWHSARVTCERQIHSHFGCPTCPKTCQLVASPLRCAILVGPENLARMVQPECSESAYFSSIMRIAEAQTRRRRVIRQRGFGKD
jgi:hypothetical protein